MKKFGLEIVSPEEEKSIQEKLKRFTLPEEDGAVNVQYGGYYGIYMDMDGNLKNDIELINKYRDMAAQPELDEAIEDIINEAIVFDEEGVCVKLNLERLDGISENIKGKIEKEFENILNLLEWRNKGYEIFRNWYVDGRIYYHVLLDEKNIKNGIAELNYVDPRLIKKVRQIIKEKDVNSGLEIIKKVDEYYIYNQNGIMNAQTNVGIQIAKDAVAYIPSGLLSPKKNQVVSYLHKAIKPANQLRMVEDALVIYRLSRAPERRLFYIDVGTMSTAKANQYVKDIQQNFKNKLVYDATTGEIRDDRKFMSMLEDFWLPRREGGRGTEISTLPGGQNLGDIEDILYFQKKLYKALNVPTSRLEAGTGFSLGRSTEITRDELKFFKFVEKLRNKFAQFFDILLSTQLSIKGICSKEDWKKWRNDIFYEFLKDNNFDELKENELKTERFALLATATPYVGQYFSREYVMKNILRMTDEEILEMDTQIKIEIADATNPMQQMMKMAGTGGMGGMGMPGDPMMGGGMPGDPNAGFDPSQGGLNSSEDPNGNESDGPPAPPGSNGGGNSAPPFTNKNKK